MTTPLLIHIASGNIVGVAERYAHDVCRHFIDRGWKTIVLTRGVRSVDSFFQKSNIPIIHAPLRRLIDPSSVLSILRLIRSHPAQNIVVHVHNYSDAFTAMLARKLSRNGNVSVIMTRHKAKKAHNNRLAERIYRNLDAHLFVSTLARDRFLDAWPDRHLPPGATPLQIMYFSINHQLLNEPLPEPERGPVTAMFHGPVKPGEGLETLIDALSLMQKTRMRLCICGVGDPDYTDMLRERAIARHVMDRIDWKKPALDPADDFSLCHFGVLPADKEAIAGYHNILFLSYGRPQVATSLGAPLEFLHNDSDSLLVNINNATQLAEAMRKLAEQPELRHRMAINALHNFNSHLSWDRFIGRLTKFYATSKPH